VNLGRMYKALDLSWEGEFANVVAFVDTGSDRTMISKRVADKLGIHTTAMEWIQVGDGRLFEAGIGKVNVLSYADGIDREMVIVISDVPFDVDYEEGIEIRWQIAVVGCRIAPPRLFFYFHREGCGYLYLDRLLSLLSMAEILYWPHAE